MRKRLERSLEIEELELRTPPSVILGCILPGMEALLDVALVTVSSPHPTSELTTPSANILDSSEAVPVGFESLALGYQVPLPDSFSLPDALNFTSHETILGGAESTPLEVPLFENGPHLLQADSIEIQAEIAAPLIAAPAPEKVQLPGTQEA